MRSLLLHEPAGVGQVAGGAVSPRSAAASAVRWWSPTRLSRAAGVSWRAVPVRRLVASIGKESEVEMKYLAFIWSQGRSAPEELAVMQRELPGYIEEMERR